MKRYLNRINRIEKQLKPNKQAISDDELQAQSEYYAKEIRRYLHDDVPMKEVDLVHLEQNEQVIDETMKQLSTDELKQIVATE